MHVTLAFRLHDAAGLLRDEVTPREPLAFVHGYAQVIPGLEDGLLGARPGERRVLHLEPEQAFGERDPDARLEIDRRDFPSTQPVAVGDEIVCTAPDGSECAYVVVEVGEQEIVADRNHPLAGERVRFDVEVLAVRRASEDELRAAEIEMDERIVYADSIGYGSDPDGEPDEGSDACEPSVLEASGTPLVQLRRNPKSGS